MKKYSNPKILISLLFILGLSLRIFGINWDQGGHLHPDERFLTMVSNDIHLPSSIIQYFDRATSPLNPYNYSQFQFFVYGIFPVTLTKITAVILRLDTYQYLHLVGRSLSALFDSVNIILLYLIAKKLLFKKGKLVYLPSFLYATTVLPIQLSHFFAVDTFLTTFLLATFTLLIYSRFLLSGVTYGLALACKISAITFAPIVMFFLIKRLLDTKRPGHTLLTSLGFGVVSLSLFRVANPYIFDGIFLPNSQYIDNLKTLQSFSNPEGWFPPAVQWMSKIPLQFSLLNIVVWGLGVPSTIIFVVSQAKHKLNVSPFMYFVTLFWVVSLYLFQGSQFAHNMRYFLPIYPFIFLLIVFKLSSLKPVHLRLLIVLHVLFGIAFMNIYTKPHTRMVASKWIYSNIPAGSLLTFEEWDDPLPLSIDSHNSQRYVSKGLSLYDPDQPKKWDKLNPIINSANYMILSSNRLWASIPQVSHRYPQTTEFYQQLFSNKLSYRRVLEVSSYPGFNIEFMKKCYYFGPSNIPGVQNKWFEVVEGCKYPGVYLRDDTAEESYSVYDHPKVFIFQRSI